MIGRRRQAAGPVKRPPSKSRSASKKAVRYEEEKMHVVRVLILALITLGFFGAAALSVYTVLKTKEIIQHPGIYRKHRDYSCSEETDDREAITTGTLQVLTIDNELMGQLGSHLSDELNPNPNFEADNPNEPELPVGYRNTNVGSAQGVFLHNKLRNTLDTFANIAPGSNGQSGWYMDYIPVDAGKFYLFETEYIIDADIAHIVVEEVDALDQRRYTDLTVLSRTLDRVQQRLLFMPATSTVKLRFYSQINSMGSMSIFKESVRALANASLDLPMVSISFDDGWKSVYDNAKPILDAHGAKSSQYIIAESFRNVLSGYMSLGEVKTLEREGHEIASHSLRHCNLARLSPDDLSYDIKASKTTLETEFKDITGLAYPYGSFNADVKALAAENYDYVRTTENGYNALVSDTNELRAVTVRPDMTTQEFRSLVDFAIERNLWLNLIYHKVEDSPDVYGVTPQALNEQLAYIKSKNLRILTVKEAVAEINSQRENL